MAALEAAPRFSMNETNAFSAEDFETASIRSAAPSYSECVLIGGEPLIGGITVSGPRLRAPVSSPKASAITAVDYKRKDAD